MTQQTNEVTYAPVVPGVFHAVVTYATTRCYGGPEEGGWWYDAGELERIEGFYPEEEIAYATMRALNEMAKLDGHTEQVAHVVQIPRTENRFASEICHMDDVDPDDTVTRFDIPTSFPEGRPHYC